jgi:hypothetical protein
VVLSAIRAIPDAVERFFEDLKSRDLFEATIDKQNVLLRKRFLPWCKTRGFHSLRQIRDERERPQPSGMGDEPLSPHRRPERQARTWRHVCWRLA